MVQEILSNVIKKNKGLKLAVIGLGYVGLPLALEFAKKRKVIAYDLNQIRINELKASIDKNLETSKKQFKNDSILTRMKMMKAINYLLVSEIIQGIPALMVVSAFSSSLDTVRIFFTFTIQLII